MQLARRASPPAHRPVSGHLFLPRLATARSGDGATPHESRRLTGAISRHSASREAFRSPRRDERPGFPAHSQPGRRPSRPDGAQRSPGRGNDGKDRGSGQFSDNQSSTGAASSDHDQGDPGYTGLHASRGLH